MSRFHCSDLSFGNCCSYTNMPKIQSKGKKVANTAKTRSLLRSKASARELADGRTFTCPTCAYTVTRARNIRYHMCEMHNVWCKTLRQTVSFPQPDSIFRLPTVKENEKYGHGKPLPAPKVKKHVPNFVVYEDISENGDVPTAPSVGVDDVAVPYNDPVLYRILLKSYSAAAGSATQPIIDEVVVPRASRLGQQYYPSTTLVRITSLHRLDVRKDCQTSRSITWNPISDVRLNRGRHVRCFPACSVS